MGRGDTKMGVEVMVEEGAASTEVLMSGVVAKVNRVVGPDQSAMRLGTLAGIGVGDGRMPGYLHGVYLTVFPSSMWMAAGTGKYHLAHQRKEKVYIAKSTLSDSMWGLFF